MIFVSNNSFSNSRFKLINKNGVVYIRKFLKLSGNRNIKSIIKQNNFKDQKFQNFNIISAKTKTSINTIKKNKYYDMIFYDGINGDQILKRANTYDVSVLKYWIKKTFFTKKITRFYKLDNKIYFNKVHDILKKIKKKKFLKIFVKKYIPEFKKKINKKIYYPCDSFCHGDLTLANIIINKKKLILLDFLETHNDNVIQDYAKLYQEFKLGWSSRGFNSILGVRSSIIYQNIISDNEWKFLDIRTKKALFIETYMTLLRILPYINQNDTITIDWVLKSINKLKINKFIK
jgi:thiamine kinase-like enzyme